MSGKRAEETESKKAMHEHSDEHAHGSHLDKLRADAYDPPLNHRVLNADGTVVPGKPGPHPKLSDLTIDERHVKIYDTPRQDATAAERRAAAHREMPVSNQHFRDLVKQGAEFMEMNDGGFNLAMKNALEEAHQSDKFASNGKHEHIDQMLKWVNADLAGTFYTLRRHGDNIQMYDTHETDKKPAGTYNLNTRKWE